LIAPFSSSTSSFLQTFEFDDNCFHRFVFFFSFGQRGVFLSSHLLKRPLFFLFISKRTLLFFLLLLGIGIKPLGFL
jgi:hypothetical protein